MEKQAQPSHAAMALTQAPRTGALVPMGVGVARLFLKKF